MHLQLARSPRLRRYAAALLALLVLTLAAFVLLPTPRADAQAAPFFPLGIFEDGNMTNTPRAFEAMINDLRPRGFDTVLFTNNILRFHAPLMDVSDRLGFNVIWAPM